MDDQQSDLSGQTTPSTIMTPTSTSQMMIPGLQPYQQPIYNQQQQQQQVPAQHPPTPTLLGPGEIIRNSGKFAKPTRIPGKNYCKDEVVIRNADSGKGKKKSFLGGFFYYGLFIIIFCLFFDFIFVSSIMEDRLHI